VSPEETDLKRIMEWMLGDVKSKCEIRPGIGLCDQCGLPKWPQRYMGYGSMICLDCLEQNEHATEEKK
jgi:hypothetical protein